MFIVRKSHPPIIAIGYELGFLLKVGLISGVNCHDTILSLAKTTGIIFIQNSTAGKSPRSIFINSFRDSDWKMLPMHEVSAGGMSPTHMPPFIFKRILLVV